MIFNYFNRKNIGVGLDISNTGIAVVELHFKSKNVVLVNSGYHEVKGNITQDNLEHQKLLLLQKFVATNKLKKNKLYLAIPSLYVISKELEFASVLNEYDIKTKLDLEQNKYFPGISEKLVFDFFAEKKEQNDESLRNVIVYAAKSSVMEEKAKFIKQAGMKVNCIEPDSFAWVRLVRFCKDTTMLAGGVGVFIVMHVGKIIFFTNNRVLYEKEIAKMSDLCEVNVEIIKQTLTDFKLTNNYKFIKMFMIGEKCTCEIITEKLGEPITYIDPFAKITILQKDMPHKHKLQIFLALGLALRGKNALD